MTQNAPKLVQRRLNENCVVFMYIFRIYSLKIFEGVDWGCGLQWSPWRQPIRHAVALLVTGDPSMSQRDEARCPCQRPIGYDAAHGTV